jgi:hypothetical protein
MMSSQSERQAANVRDCQRVVSDAWRKVVRKRFAKAPRRGGAEAKDSILDHRAPQCSETFRALGLCTGSDRSGCGELTGCDSP